MITFKQGMRVSAIIDKLELKIIDPTANTEQVGSDLIMQIVSKAHKAEQEIYALVADIKKITVQEAEDVDLVDFIKVATKDSGLMDFFKSAAMSKMKD